MLTNAVLALRTFNRWLHLVAAAVLLFIMAITVINIFLRRFAEPLAGTVEVTAILMTVVVFLGMPHSEDEGDHISVDLLYEQVGDRAKKALSIFGRVVGVVILAALTRQLWNYAALQDAGSYTTTVREWPIHPFVRIASFGALLLTLSTLANLIFDVFGLELPEASADEVDDKAMTAL